MRGLISGLGRLSLSFSFSLPRPRFPRVFLPLDCGAGGSVYMGDDDRGRVALMGQ